MRKTYIILLLFLSITLNKLAYCQQEVEETGWLKVIANLEQYYLIIDDDFTNPFLVSRGDSICVKAGNRNIRLVWQTINDHSFTINVKSGKTEKVQVYISHYPAYPRSSFQTIVSQTNLFITTDENSTVYINGKEAGKHIVQTIVKPGSHLLRIEHPEYRTLKKRVKVNSLNVTGVARFNENPSTLSFAAKLLPGAEYIASKRYGRAVITYVGLGLLTANLIRQDRAYLKKLNEFNEWNTMYQDAQTTEDAIDYRKNAIIARESLDEIGTNFNHTLLITAGVYLISTLDAFRKPISGYRGDSNFSQNLMLGVTTGTINNQAYPSLTFNYQIK